MLPRTRYSSGFLLACTLLILWCKSGPRYKLLCRPKHGHISTDFRKDGNSGQGCADTRNSHKQVDLGLVFCGELVNQGFKRAFQGVDVAYVLPNKTKFFNLCRVEFSVKSGPNFFRRGFAGLNGKLNQEGMVFQMKITPANALCVCLVDGAAGKIPRPRIIFYPRSFKYVCTRPWIIRTVSSMLRSPAKNGRSSS